MRYKHIFWDFNGTLIDDVGTALGCVNDLLDRKGRPHITLEDYYTYVETPIIGFYRHILPPEELDFAEISRDYHIDYAKRADETHLAEGAYELVHSLKEKGIKQYIVTANIQSEAEELLKKFDIFNCIDVLIGAENTLAESKTERAVKLFDSLGIDPNEAIFVGDTLHDLETANALGIDCVLVSYGHQGRRLLQENNAYVVDSIAELSAVLYDERCIDFHTHSTCSDGTMTPTELVLHAKKQGLSVIALTDHDSVDGIKEASVVAKEIEIEFVPGIEFSAADETETHIVGLFVDPENQELLSTVERLRTTRANRMKDTCNKLCALGMNITYQEVLHFAGDVFVGRAHIAQLMVNKGYCKTIKECFEKYIGLGKPAYSEKVDFCAEDAIRAINSSGGLSFLAHLHQTNYDINQLEALLIKLKKAGLTGIEGYYTEYTPEHVRQYRELALKLGLAISGGSDFHADIKPHIEIGVGEGNLKIPYYVYENLKGLKGRK